MLQRIRYKKLGIRILWTDFDALNEISIEFIGISDVGFSLTDIANEFQILDGSNLMEYPTNQALITSTYINESTILKSENPETKEIDVRSVPAGQIPKIDAAEMKETTVEKPESENSETKKTDIPGVSEEQTSKNKPAILSSVVIRQAFQISTDDSTDKIWNKYLHWPIVGDKSVKKGQQKVLTEQVLFAITSKNGKKLKKKKITKNNR